MPDNEGASPTEELLAGRRALEELKRVSLLEDWVWYERIRRWVLRCRLKPEIDASGPIPAESDWYALVESSYPWGSIVFYPAIEGGIGQTFSHQNYNGDHCPNTPWRGGRLCVDTSLHSLGRRGYDVEPYAVEERLKWHFRRALEWLTEASFGRLVQPGDPYELPFFPTVTKTQIAFSEGPETFSTWQTISNKVGIAMLGLVPGTTSNLYVQRFTSVRGDALATQSWGTKLTGSAGEDFSAGWILLVQVPVIEPWQAPMTWGELWAACQRQGKDIYSLVKSLAPRLRDGREHVLLLGAPIPEKVGAETNS